MKKDCLIFIAVVPAANQFVASWQKPVGEAAEPGALVIHSPLKKTAPTINCRGCSTVN